MIICLCLYLMILSYFSRKAPEISVTIIIGPMIDIKYNHTFVILSDSHVFAGDFDHNHVKASQLDGPYPALFIQAIQATPQH